MTFAQVDTKKAEVAVGLVLLAIVAVVARETLRLGAGWGPSGPRPGFFPLIASVLIAIGAVVVIVRALRAPAMPLYDSRDQCLDVLKLAAPLAIAVAAMSYVGFYVMTAVYMAFFAACYGRYRWYVVAAASILLPLALFLAFERGFRISLPKSIWYGDFVSF